MATNQIKKKLTSFIEEIPTRLQRKSTLQGPLLSSLHHFNSKTGRDRQKRGDRRSNIIQVLNIMLTQMDLETFAWGQFFQRRDGTVDFYTRGLKYIQKRTGMTEKTISRVIKDLEQGGYLKSYPMEGMGKDGKEIKYYSLRKFTNKIFYELGFTKERVNNIKEWKRKDNEKKYSGKLSKVFTNGLGKLSKIFKDFSKVAKPLVFKLTAPTYSDSQALANKKKKLSGQAIDMAVQQGRSVSECYKELLILHGI